MCILFFKSILILKIEHIHMIQPYIYICLYVYVCIEYICMKIEYIHVIQHIYTDIYVCIYSVCKLPEYSCLKTIQFPFSEATSVISFFIYAEKCNVLHLPFSHLTIYLRYMAIYQHVKRLSFFFTAE